MADGPLAVKGCKTKFHWPHWKNVKSTVQPDSGLSRMMLVIKADQLRFQYNLIGVNGPELKLFEDVLSKGFQRPVVGGISVKALPWHGVDVVDDQVHIPLGEELEGSTFRKDLPEERVDVLHAAFLGGAHRITVIDTCPFNAVDTGFETFRIAELSSAIGQYDLEHREKVKGTQTLL